MIYDIKAVTTEYAKVRFRSRLEARWAAFFDLAGWDWDYEPIDLKKWAPDFLIQAPACPVYAEVKPVNCENGRLPVDQGGPFQKAVDRRCDVQVLLLGAQPRPWAEAVGVGMVLLHPAEDVGRTNEVLMFTCVEGARDMWREAGNMVQWLRT